MRSLTRLTRIIAGLALGGAGGLAFYLVSLPLPWMLGALCVTMLASVAALPVEGPTRLRPGIVAIIGVLLGSQFTPDVLDRTGEAALSLSILSVYLLVVAAVIVPYYRYVGRQGWTTAYYAGMPGGLSEMVELGEARGANVPAIVLAHSLRIVLTIGLMAFLFRVVLGHEAVSAAPVPTGGMTLLDATLLAGSAVLGPLAGRSLRLPAPDFLGPLILSAVAHLTGLTSSVPPPGLVIAAQVALGTILGCRFQGIPRNMLLRTGLLSLGATVLTIALALAGATAMQKLAGVRLDQGLLALAPGGLTEMGLIALAINADVAFVAVHHVVRILIVIVAAPLLSGWIRRD